MTTTLKKSLILIPAVFAGLVLAGCGSRAVTGAAVGAAAVGGAYEYQNKEAMDQLENDYRRGHISRDEYERRRAEIGDKSLIY